MTPPAANLPAYDSTSTSSSGRWGRWLKLATVAAALMPVGWAVAVQSHPSAPTEFAVPERPALAFQQYQVDLGKVFPTQEVSAVFKFLNRGDRPVRIETVDASCGCLIPRLDVRDYAAGSPGQIVLRTRPANAEPGKKEYYVDVKYYDPEPRSVRLTLKMELPERGLYVRPRALAIYQWSDETAEHEIVLNDTRGGAFNVLSMKVAPEIARAELGERETTDDGLLQKIRVIVDGAAASGRKDAVLSIQTDDKNYPLIRVPLMIFGRPNDSEIADRLPPASKQ